LSDQYPPPPWGGRRAGGDRNQVPDRFPYQTEPGVWRFGPDAASGYQRGGRPSGRNMKSVTIGVVALVVLAAAWVVTHRGPKAGPLSDPFQGGGWECLGLDGKQVMTYGVEWVRNPGAAMAVIDQMTLAKPEGMRAVASWVVPTSGLLYGAQDGYPPSQMPLPGWQWARREPAGGAKVPHTLGNNKVNLLLVLGLNSGATGGQAAGIDIWYHVGSSHYHLRTAQRLFLAPGEVALPSCGPVAN
jgi:hypothetical protein